MAAKKAKKAQVGLLIFLLIVFAILMMAAIFAVGDNSILNKKKQSQIKETNKIIHENLLNVNKKVSFRSLEMLAFPCELGGKDDLDEDDVPDLCDNCPLHYNPEQLNYDNDRKGNVCDSDPTEFDEEDSDFDDDED